MKPTLFIQLNPFHSLLGKIPVSPSIHDCDE
jgi:hypothetical protein